MRFVMQPWVRDSLKDSASNAASDCCTKSQNTHTDIPKEPKTHTHTHTMQKQSKHRHTQ